MVHLFAQEGKYDMVVAAHTLAELATRPLREKALLDLWNATRGYLVHL